MDRFIVDVEFSTHDDLQRGVTRLGCRRVEVFADSDHEATLVAAQLVACVTDKMPTRTIIIDVLV